MTPQKVRADYGIDAPGVIRNLFIAGVVGIILGWFLPSPRVFGHHLPSNSIFLVWGIWTVATSVFMVLYAKIGKLRHMERMLNMVAWKGNEVVLDIGTGRGLLMIGAAKRLSSGKSYGIDIWNAEDLSDNTKENALRNIDLEGVKSKAELRCEDAREMSFPDAFFDVILSNLCVHNIYDPEGRAKACSEIARVLKPGGVALISDFRHTAEYETALNAAGLHSSRSRPFLLDTFPPLRIVKAIK